MGATRTARRWSCISAGDTTTHGRVFLISLPTVGSRFTSQISPRVTRPTPNPRIAKFAHHEFVVTSLGDSPGGLGPTGARRTRGPAQHKCTILDRHFRSRLAVQTQLRKYRFWDDNSLGVAYLSNAYVY